jgi:hypothetical protein
VAARPFDVPSALVTIVDENRIWFKSGLEVRTSGPWPATECAKSLSTLLDAAVRVLLSEVFSS